jgi:signal transduction histidine kinase/CheY-like chemotaxis protein
MKAARRAPVALSIRRRAMRVMLTTTLLALLLSATALLVYELLSHRNSWTQDLQTQADLVAQASVPALNFDDPRTARENLGLLRLRPQIEAAALYDARGRRFADYHRPDEAALPEVLAGAAAGPLFRGDRLELRQPVVQQGEPIGTMVVRARYDVLPRLIDYLAILGAVTTASLALAALVGRRMQNAITDPIVAVSDVARDIVHQRNYALRAPKTSDDEVGALVDAFNDMLRVLGDQAAALRATDRRKDEFLATLAHELRNPLAPVSTALAILQRGGADPDTVARLLAVMQRQTAQLVRLIDDLMEVSRISTGRLSLRCQRLNLVDVVRTAVESVTPLLLERSHHLAVHWPAPVWVEGDPTRLGQVFANLLANAAKYTQPGGRLALAFDVQGAQVAVSIADNGIGIAPEMQQEVFEMFVQVDRSLSRGRAGLGVGLSLARQLVALHGGRITLHSGGLGCGCTFTVQLPLLASAPAVAATAAPAAAPALRALQVLLADDNRDFTDSLALALQAGGHSVRVAYDGQAALRAAAERLPEVGLFDIGMPQLDGYALAQQLRQLPGAQRCLLVAITGWGLPADREKARAAGFDEHLVKPVDLDTLLRLLAARAPARADQADPAG